MLKPKLIVTSHLLIESHRQILEGKHLKKWEVQLVFSSGVTKRLTQILVKAGVLNRLDNLVRASEQPMNEMELMVRVVNPQD